MGIMPLPTELLDRIRDRAADPHHRTDSAAAGMRMRGLCGRLRRLSNRLARLPGPVSEARLARAEVKLGFVLPLELRQLYLGVADGAFGPGGGIYRLDELVAKYREMTPGPIGEGGQLWPAGLLPITGEGWDLLSIDRDGGELVFFDVDELEGRSDRAWKRAFRRQHDGFEAWLTRWVDKPILQPRRHRPKPRQYSQEEMERWEADNPEYVRRSAILRMTAAERAAIGLPARGWEEKVWEGFDFGSVKRVRRMPRAGS
jgi:hypothetical protein